MATFDLPGIQAAQASPGDMALSGDFQHAGAQEAGVNRQRHKRNRHGRQDDMLPAAVAQSRQPL